MGARSHQPTVRSPEAPVRLKTSRALSHHLDAVRLLVREPLTAYELGAELGLTWRTAYRLVAQLREAGLDVQQSPRREHDRGTPTSEYSIRPDHVRQRLGLAVRR